MVVTKLFSFFSSFVNREQTHPGISDYLNSGALSVRRTTKNFARSPRDLTLEQTVNKDAASRFTGVSAFTTSASGRLRWSVTRAARSRVVSILLEKAGLKDKEESVQVR